MWPGCDSQTQRHMWGGVCCWFLVLALRGFPPDISVFPFLQKPIWITVKHFIMRLWLRRLSKDFLSYWHYIANKAKYSMGQWERRLTWWEAITLFFLSHHPLYLHTLQFSKNYNLFASFLFIVIHKVTYLVISNHLRPFLWRSLDSTSIN